MAYDEAHQKRSRVVVETPAARREVVETRTAYAEPERRGVSTGVVAIVAIAAVVLTAIVAWALTRPSEEPVTTTSRVATQPTPITQVVTVPVPQQQPVVMPPATTTTTTQPVIVPVPSTTASTTPSTTESSSGTDDSTIQSNIEKKFSDDPKVAALGITVSVVNGKATLIGTVDSREMKNRVERMARIKGIKSVDNQIIVSGSGDSSAGAQD
jgi:hypothetical protein